MQVLLKVKLSLPNRRAITLSVLPIEELLPHENVIPTLLATVRRDMIRTGFQRDPIVIDKRTKVVLDGMHRRASLVSLGARFGLCVEFDYLDKSVLLERWLRYFIAPDRKFINDLISLLQLNKSRDFRTAMRAVDKSGRRLSLLSNKESYVGKRDREIINSYEKLAKFDELAKSNMIEIQFHPEGESFSLLTSKSVFAIYPPKLEKKKILSMAKKGLVLPFKSTKHTVPIRPMGVYFPLDLLIRSNLARCKSKLEEISSNSRIDLLERGSWYEGRRYAESLAIFR